MTVACPRSWITSPLHFKAGTAGRDAAATADAIRFTPPEVLPDVGVLHDGGVQYLDGEPALRRLKAVDTMQQPARDGTQGSRRFPEAILAAEFSQREIVHLGLNASLVLWVDISPQVGAYESGDMADVACRHNQISGGNPESQGLGGEDDVSVELLRIACGEAALPRLRPQIGGKEHRPGL